jgi:hypothetical protein
LMHSETKRAQFATLISVNLLLAKALPDVFTIGTGKGIPAFSCGSEQWRWRMGRIRYDF